MKTPKEVLEYYHISFVERHKSVTHLCFGIDCPFCKDTKKHCGVFKDSGNFSCWKCGKKGSLYQLVVKLMGCTYSDFRKVYGVIDIKGGSVMENLNRIFDDKKEDTQEPNEKRNEKASVFSPIKENGMLLSSQIIIDNFLIQRHFTYETLAKFRCMYCHSGFLSQRLVIPLREPDDFFIERGFIGRDMTGTANRKYIIQPFGVQLDNYLYFTNNIPPCRPVVLVEGVFDAWAIDSIGFVGTAMLGSNLSEGKIQLLRERAFHIIYIPDDDVLTAKVIETKTKLHDNGFEVNLIQLPSSHDPCSCNRKELKQRIEEIVK